MMARINGTSPRLTAVISGERASLGRPTTLSGDSASISWAGDNPDANFSNPATSLASTSCATDIALAKDALEASFRWPRGGDAGESTQTRPIEPRPRARAG